MSSKLQTKCNDLIKLAAEISLLSCNDVNDVNDLDMGDNEDSSNNNKKIKIGFIDNYDCGDLFIKIMGLDDHKGKYKWISIIEYVDNYYSLRGEVKFPLHIRDITMDGGCMKYIINFSDVTWKDNIMPIIVEDEVLIESCDECTDGQDSGGEYSGGEYSEDEESGGEESGGEESGDEDSEENISEEELIIKKEGIHVSIV